MKTSGFHGFFAPGTSAVTCGGLVGPVPNPYRPGPESRALPLAPIHPSMFTRTCLLATCMIVVPLIAMFSHKVPRSVRETVRDSVRVAIRRSVPAWAVSERTSSEANSPPGQRPADAASGGGERIADGGLEQGALPALPPTREGVGDDERRLEALGAEGIECHRSADPAAGGRPDMTAGGGLHVASCRLPVDPAGQLHRLFSAQADSPANAIRTLRLQVESWKARVADRSGTRVE